MTSPSETKTEDRRILGHILGSGLVLAGIAVPFFGIASAPSVVLGAFLSAFNVWVITRTVRSFLAPGSAFGWVLAAFLKLSVLLAALYLLFDAGLVQGFPLMIGLSSLPIGIVLMQLSSAKESGEDSSSART